MYNIDYFIGCILSPTTNKNGQKKLMSEWPLLQKKQGIYTPKN